MNLDVAYVPDLDDSVHAGGDHHPWLPEHYFTWFSNKCFFSPLFLPPNTPDVNTLLEQMLWNVDPSM
jgi:hypothetical protein